MRMLQTWWNRLFSGRRPIDPVTTGSGMRARSPGRHAGPTAAKPGLELASAPRQTKRKRVGAAGFDPYGNDGGYSKPHGWERVDHR